LEQALDGLDRRAFRWRTGREGKVKVEDALGTIVEEVRKNADLHQSMMQWRRDFHRHPEIGFGEHRTAARIAELLRDWGIEVTTGVGGTGVVGIIDGCRGLGRSIALRADMDALPIVEQNDFAHMSAHHGLMHGCGHDGHSAMLLGAARHLADGRDFAGRIVLIFQPAEEVLTSGAREMIADGVLDRFPFEAIYAVHNYPPLAPGTAAVRTGPFLASADSFHIEVTGLGGHGAQPHLARSPVAPACEIALALQRIASQSVNALDNCVVNTTMVRTGDTHNVIPDTALIGGTVRCFREEVRKDNAAEIDRIATNIARAHGCEAKVDYVWGHPATINTAREAERAATVLTSLLGDRQVITDHPQIMGSEDFAYFLQQRRGAYIVLGQGGSMIHNPRYDFNDEILSTGAAYFVGIALSELAGGPAKPSGS
jgi:hippurate hydrolase